MTGRDQTWPREQRILFAQQDVGDDHQQHTAPLRAQIGWLEWATRTARCFATSSSGQSVSPKDVATTDATEVRSERSSRLVSHLSPRISVATIATQPAHSQMSTVYANEHNPTSQIRDATDFADNTDESNVGSASSTEHSVSFRADDETSDVLTRLQGLRLEQKPSEESLQEAITPRTFTIPEEVMNATLLAKPGAQERFWSYRKYRNSDNETPRLDYCTTAEAAETIAAAFLKEAVLGFDLEWEITNNIPTEANIKRAVSVIQLASESRVAIFQLALFDAHTAEQFMPESLRKILSSPQYIKAGVNVVGDAARILACFDLEMKGLYELSHLYKQVKYASSEPSKVNKSLVGLAAQVEDILGLPLHKGEVRTSAWSKAIGAKEKEYAASDAYAGYQLFVTLDDLRKKMDPAPSRPWFYELKLPIPLPDGRLSEDESESDAASEQSDVPAPAPSPARRRRSGSKVETPAGAEQAGSTDDTVPVIISNVRPQSEEYELARSWAASHRATLDDRKRKLVPETELRAYHLWHVQSHDLATTAGLMRSPENPLAKSTVAGYVFRSLYHCRLPYNTSRLEQVSGHLSIYDKKFIKLVMWSKSSNTYVS